MSSEDDTTCGSEDAVSADESITQPTAPQGTSLIVVIRIIKHNE